VCVVRYTFERVAQLDALNKLKAPPDAPANLPSAPQAPQLTNPAVASDPKTPSTMPVGLTYIDDGYKALSSKQQRQGKWYYELLIDRDGIAKLGDVLLSLGFAGDSGSGVVRMVNIRRSHVGAPPVSMGFAIDLDNGAVFIRQNGVWNFTPGTVGGPEVKLNHSYRASIEGSSEVRELIRLGLVKVNLGDRPFEYSLPDGFRPLAE